MSLTFKGTYSIGCSNSNLVNRIVIWDNANHDLINNSVSYKECYGIYFNNSEYKNAENFIFSFHSIPVWYTRVINKFNRKFKNIKYKVLSERNVYIYTNNWGESFASEKPVDNKVNHAVKQVLFTIEFSNEYSKESKYYLRYFLHHFLRLLSFSEGFLDYTTPEHPKKDDSLSLVLGLNNKNPGYRSLVEGEITLKEFMLLDDYELVNKAFDKSNFVDKRQTEIMSRILIESGAEVKGDFKVGDFICGTNKTFEYSISNVHLEKGVVEEVLPYNRVKVKILKYPSYREYIGRTFTFKTEPLSLYEEKNDKTMS